MCHRPLASCVRAHCRARCPCSTLHSSVVLLQWVLSLQRLRPPLPLCVVNDWCCAEWGIHCQSGRVNVSVMMMMMMMPFVGICGMRAGH